MVKEIASEVIELFLCNKLPVANRLAIVLTALPKELNSKQTVLVTIWQSTDSAISFEEMKSIPFSLIKQEDILDSCESMAI